MGKRKETWLADIEVFPNLMSLGVYSYKEDLLLYYEISPRIDQREELYKVLKNFDGYFVTFNGNFYDCVVLSYILKDWDKLKNLEVLEFLRKVKEFSNSVINDDHDKIKFYKWFKKPWIDIDLFCFWSKMLRMSKKISLKSLGIQLGHIEVQELPFEHDKILSNDEIEQIKIYNQKNDIGIMKLLFNEMKEEISLRGYINKEYGLECWSQDAPKMASELLLKSYCEKTINLNLELKDYINQTRKIRYDKGILYIKNILGNFDPKFELDIFKQFFDRVLNSTRDFSDSFPVNYGSTSLSMSYGIGGAHSAQKNECFKSDKDNIIITSDFALIQWRN